MSEAAASISVIVVAHDSAGVLPACLRTLGRPAGLEVTVVDNCSSDGSALVAENGGARVVRLPSNTGFAHACNAGVAALEAPPDWLGFVNPDVTVVGRDLLRMVSEAPPEVAAISPLLGDERGQPLRDLARVEPGVWTTSLRWLATSILDRRARRAHAELAHGPGRYLDVEVTSGGCLLVRAPAFHAVGGFCEAYFFNMEDVELSCRIRAAGGVILVDREVRGRHDKGTSSSSVTARQRMLEYARAEVLFFERNRPAWQTLVVAPCVLAGCLARMVLHPGKTRPAPAGRTGTDQSWLLLRTLAGSVARRLSGRPPPSPARSIFFETPFFDAPVGRPG